MMSAAKNIDISRPLTEQKKPDFVCEPGDIRVKKYGWTKANFKGCLSIEGNTIWISSIWSKHMGKGNYSRLIKKLHEAGFEIKVPCPFPRMEAICLHKNFIKTQELHEQTGESIDVWVMPP